MSERHAAAADLSALTAECSSRSLADLSQVLIRGGIVSSTELERTCQRVATAGGGTAEPVDPSALLQDLVERGRLTPFQLQAIAERQADRLRIGEYTVLRPLGAGGMGAVVLAIHRRMQRQVAIKLLPRRFSRNAEMVARFERQVAVAAQLVHPHLVTAYDAGQDGQVLYLVMEFVDGCDLSSLVRSAGPLPLAAAARCVIQAADGMTYAHATGVIHRDLKPANLLLSTDGVVKVLDLGLARWRTEAPQTGVRELSATGMAMGTVDYMAPEQATNAKSADERSDIYSLGCTLFALHRGRPVYPGDAVVECILAHRESPLPDLVPDDPNARANEVFRMMVAKRPESRFATMAEVGAALLELLPADDRRLEIATVLPDLRVSSSVVTETYERLPQRSLAETSPLAVGPGETTRMPAARRPWVSRRRLLVAGGTLAGLAAGGWLGASWWRARGRPQIIEGPLPRDVLLVGQSGRVHFTRIGDALRHVKSGMTIRVTDDAVYTEVIQLVSRSQSDITIESIRQATIVPRSDVAITITNVPGVTVRGFRFSLPRDKAGFSIVGTASGTLLDRLEFRGIESGDGIRTLGISLEGIARVPAKPPVVVRHCVFRGIQLAVRVSGLQNDYRSPQPCGGVLLHDCMVQEATGGFDIVGEVRDVVVAGNLMIRLDGYGIELEQILPGASGFVIANNTIIHAAWPFRVWSERLPDDRVIMVNNVTLDSGQPDWSCVDNQGDRAQDAGPGDIDQLLSRWMISHNFREGHTIDPGVYRADAWIPPTETDRLLPRIEAGPRGDLDTIGPPPSSSPLVKGGFGDPFPSYAGALAPPGVSFNWRELYDNFDQLPGK